MPDLHTWMVQHLEAFPLFERIPEADLASDPVVEQVRISTEEGRKVERNEGPKLLAVFRRLAEPKTSAPLDVVDEEEEKS